MPSDQEKRYRSQIQSMPGRGLYTTLSNELLLNFHTDISLYFSSLFRDKELQSVVLYFAGMSVLVTVLMALYS